MPTHQKIKPKTDEAAIGQVILNYWESDPQWTKQQLLDQLVQVLDLQGGDYRNVVVDVITDNDIDGTSRMVWISVPTPDLKIKNVGGGPTNWKDYSLKFKQDEGTDAAQKLGSAVLFGCGR